MMITVEDRPNALLELLWIREAYGLQPQGEDLPPLLSDTPAFAQNAPLSTSIRDEWEVAWPRIWHAAVAHAGPDPDSRLFVDIQSTPNGSLERADLLHRLVGPS